MYTKTIVALSGLLSFAAAVPMVRRDIVWVTQTAEDIVTVPVTTTIWVNPTDGANGGHHHSRPTSTLTVQSTYTAPAVSSASTESAYSAPAASSSVAAPSSSTAAAPTTPSTTSTYVAPTTPATTSEAAPTTSVAAPNTSVAAPTTSEAAPATSQAAPTTSTWVAPTTSAAAPSSTSTPAASGTSPSGSTYTGDITYYSAGLGSCGITNTDSDSIVALAHGMMAATAGANPNNNPMCGKSITISHGGVTKQATITDTCGGCDGASIDLTPTLFQEFAALGVGRVSGVEWWFN